MYEKRSNLCIHQFILNPVESIKSWNVKFKTINCEKRLKIKYMSGRERRFKTCT